MNFKIGDILKVNDSLKVFKVRGLSRNRLHIDDGWPIDINGNAYNPKFCSLYKGATSVLNLENI